MKFLASLATRLQRLVPDPFILALLVTLLLATTLPASGKAADWLGVLATSAVVLLFFLHGIRLPRENLVAAVMHWRLHLTILATTFVVLPLLGLGLSSSMHGLLPAGLWAGLLFLCTLPSTVQMSIALTSIARGNVAASVAAAAASNLLGIIATPLVAGLVLSAHGNAAPLSGIWKIVLQLLLPFAVGHLLRPWLGAWAARQRAVLSWADRLTVMISVYTAFSAAVLGGIWKQIPLVTLIILTALCAVLLTLVLTWTGLAARMLGLNPADARTLRYAGSLKSLVSGVPMAKVLFPSAEIGMIMLPIMIYHQLQLMTCAWLARRQGEASDDPV
ncbi:MAG: bile acid:sodium symporter [Nevskiaceae bacterium]|jgi:sodium/bile acid cotransporter 7|nr:bile acid:sodium symporter [Nevskiaceae bacterium]